MATAILGGRASGIGRRALEILTAYMELLPLFANRAFSEHTQDTGKVAAAISDKIMQEASCHLHYFYGKPHTRVINTGVSGDGT